MCKIAPENKNVDNFFIVKKRIMTENSTNFTQVHNTLIENPDLSWKAKGLLIYLLSRPDNWTVNKTDLLKRASDGKKSLNSTLDELKEKGFLKIEKAVKSGNILGYKYTVHEGFFDDPEKGMPKRGRPERGTPETESSKKGIHNNTNSNNTNLNNTNSNNTNLDRVKELQEIHDLGEQYGFPYYLVDKGILKWGREKVKFVLSNYELLVKEDAKGNTEYAYPWVKTWLEFGNKKLGAYEKLRSLTSTSAIKQEIKQEELSEEQKAKLKKEKWEKYEPLHTILPFTNTSSLSTAQYEVALCAYRSIADPYEKKEQGEILKTVIQHVGKENVIADCKRWWKAEANFMCPGWPEVKELGIDKVIKFVEEFEVG